MPMENDYSFEKTCQSFLNTCQGHKFRTVLADPPWQFKEIRALFRQEVYINVYLFISVQYSLWITQGDKMTKKFKLF